MDKSKVPYSKTTLMQIYYTAVAEYSVMYVVGNETHNFVNLNGYGFTVKTINLPKSKYIPETYFPNFV